MANTEHRNTLQLKRGREREKEGQKKKKKKQESPKLHGAREQLTRFEQKAILLYGNVTGISSDILQIITSFLM